MTDPGEELRRAQAQRLSRAARSGAEVSLEGVLARAEVEARPWVLTTADGTAYELVGVEEALGGAPARADRRRVVVTGRLLPDAASINQVGPLVAVDAVAPADD